MPLIAQHSASERERLARVLVAEAAGEGQEGLQAVASVIGNRSAQSGRTLVAEAYRRKQFSGVNSPLWRKAHLDRSWPVALATVDRLLAGNLPDNTGGATHYHAGPPPYWAASLRVTRRIGRHTFYR